MGREREREGERERERLGVGVHMTSAMLERHSGISAAPTAGVRAPSYLSLEPRFMRRAMQRDARACDIDALDFYSIYTAGWTRSPEKSRDRPATIRSVDCRDRKLHARDKRESTRRLIIREPTFVTV